MANDTTFKKGEGGRPKGAVNKVTKDMREWIGNFISENTEQIEKDWAELEPRDRLALFEKLLKYTLPSLSSVSTKMQLEDMSDEMLNVIIERLKADHDTTAKNKFLTAISGGFEND